MRTRSSVLSWLAAYLIAAPVVSAGVIDREPAETGIRFPHADVRPLDASEHSITAVRDDQARDAVRGMPFEVDDTIAAPVRRALGAMVDLGTLGGASSVATSVNAAGQVVGHSQTAAGATHAFRWDPDSRAMRDLGTLDLIG